MQDFSERSRETELMDQENIPFRLFHDCLEELEFINRWTFAYRPTLQWLMPKIADTKPVTVLDAGSGSGDMLRRVEERLVRRYGSADGVALIGVDLNEWSKKSAQRIDPQSEVRHETANIFDFEPQTRVDYVICSLFTHHLTDAQLVEYLRWAHRRARKGWFINDLHRHPLPYYFIKAATRLFSRNPLIRNDAAVSVARSFRVADWQRLLEKAGCDGRIQIRWHFPFRLCVSCDK